MSLSCLRMLILAAVLVVVPSGCVFHLVQDDPTRLQVVNQTHAVVERILLGVPESPGKQFAIYERPISPGDTSRIFGSPYHGALLMELHLKETDSVEPKPSFMISIGAGETRFLVLSTDSTGFRLR